LSRRALEVAPAGAEERPIALLSAAAFVSVASMRVGDSLLPQVAHEFGVSTGDASVIATTFALAYGLCQLIWGALGDRFGKYRLVALMTLISAFTGTAAAFAGSLATLGLARFAAGATAAAIVPLGMAFVGDNVPYRERQAVLARFLTGTILGLVGGQVMGGVLGDLVGWRAVFLLLGATRSCSGASGPGSCSQPCSSRVFCFTARSPMSALICAMSSA
jgi:YNFM family putative membrane transporter